MTKTGTDTDTQSPFGLDGGFRLALSPWLSRLGLTRRGRVALTGAGIGPNLRFREFFPWGDRTLSSVLGRSAAAVQRLGAAIDRLEAAAARAGAGDLLLAGELRDARDQQAQLEDTTRLLAQRLDGAIARLRTLLED